MEFEFHGGSIEKWRMEREKGFHGRIRFHSDGPRFDGGERFGYGKGEFLVSEIFVEFYVFGSFAE